MGTECSYDYVFVYNGDSFRSPLLGSFSGKTEPQQVTSTSGYVSRKKINWVALLFIQKYSIPDHKNVKKSCLEKKRNKIFGIKIVKTKF